MRSVAPVSAGMAASQNSSSVLYSKPAAGSCVTTALHTIHTAKARNRAGIYSHRFRLAMALPSASQNALSSGVQILNMRPERAAPVSFVMSVSFGFQEKYVGWGCLLLCSALSGRTSVKYIHIRDTQTMPNKPAPSQTLLKRGDQVRQIAFAFSECAPVYSTGLPVHLGCIVGH